MADIMIRKRKRMRSKEVKALAKELEDVMGVPVFSEEDGVDMAESTVTVDMGAVPYVTNGADVMGPGITEADPEIAEGDMVWIRDARNGAPLAIGVALRSGEALASKEPGKAIKTIHYVGDKLWKTGE